MRIKKKKKSMLNKSLNVGQAKKNGKKKKIKFQGPNPFYLCHFLSECVVLLHGRSFCTMQSHLIEAELLA